MFTNKENGYSPFNKLNVIVSVIVFICLALGGFGVVASIDDHGFAVGIKNAFSSSGYYGNTGLFFLVGLAGFIFLLVRNMKTGSVVKSILFTLLGIVISLILAVIVLLLGAVFGSAGTTNRPASSDSIGYSYDQNNEARNKGYSNALEAERSGKKWNGSTWE